MFSEYQIAAQHFKNKLTHFTQKEDGKIKRPVFFATVKHNSGTAKLFRQVRFFIKNFFFENSQVSSSTSEEFQIF